MVAAIPGSCIGDLKEVLIAHPRLICALAIFLQRPRASSLEDVLAERAAVLV